MSPKNKADEGLYIDTPVAAPWLVVVAPAEWVRRITNGSQPTLAHTVSVTIAGPTNHHVTRSPVSTTHLDYRTLPGLLAHHSAM